MSFKFTKDTINIISAGISLLQVFCGMYFEINPSRNIFLQPYTFMVLITFSFSIWFVYSKAYVAFFVLVSLSIISFFILLQSPTVEIIVFYNDDETFTRHLIVKEPVKIIDYNGQSYEKLTSEKGSLTVEIKNIGKIKIIVCGISSEHDVTRHSKILYHSLDVNDLINCKNKLNQIKSSQKEGI